ncbi:MAG: hypothetical protein DI569_05785 [Sphingopyxis macrogoltabida]|uniref:Uncharacterized protein n=1 Tax=Sphingopyxis macrogoltabida TaxID=33050 RepID=A0A2W5NA38_SPHMC|nr:MAG: hypothetical protein DI569_05785 [Sphingopyxis macrogoltabida]
MTLFLALAMLAANPVHCPSGASDAECRAADVAAAIDLAPDRLATLHSVCLYDYGGRCWVEASGRIRGAEQGGEIVWQKLRLAPKDGPAGWMDILVSLDGGTPRLVGYAESSGSIGSPDLVATSDDQSLIHLTGTLAGSGGGNADALFAADGAEARWRKIDIESWWDDADAMLPKGYSLRGPADYIFSEMFASIPVARDGDGHCCPRGGTAFFDLDIQGDRLIATHMRFQPMQPQGDEVDSEAAGRNR